MDIFQSKTLADLKYFTPLQLEVLEAQNVVTIADLLQILPRRLEAILDWVQTLEPNQKYKHTFEVMSVIQRKSGRGLPYFLVQLKDLNQKIYQAFLFSRASFVVNQLRNNTKVELIVSIFGNNNLGFGQPNLVIHKIIYQGKIQKINENPNTSLSDLDNLTLDIFYPKSGAKVDTTFLRRIHQKLKPEDYVLDLSGLVPISLLGSLKLDLWHAHHPKSQTEYFRALNRLQTVKVFLKSALEKYIVYNSTKNHLAYTPDLDLVWLQQNILKLPVTLTKSQKVAIWEIVQDVTVVK
jgi:RecG-like helicase